MRKDVDNEYAAADRRLEIFFARNHQRKTWYKDAELLICQILSISDASPVKGWTKPAAPRRAITRSLKVGAPAKSDRTGKPFTGPVR